MNAVPVSKFYGDKRHHQHQHILPASYVLVVDQIQDTIFKSLRFPIREKPSKTFRIKIAIADRHLFKDKTLDELMQHVTLKRPEWKRRVISELGDANVIIRSEVRVQKIRSERFFDSTDRGLVEKLYRFGYEVVVRVVRERVPASRGQVSE